MEPPNFIVLPTREIEYEGTDKENTTVILSGNFAKKYENQFQSLIENVKELFPELENRIEFEDRVVIERGFSCSLCNRSLTADDTQYLCLWCDPKHYHCEECESTPREEKDPIN